MWVHSPRRSTITPFHGANCQKVLSLSKGIDIYPYIHMYGGAYRGTGKKMETADQEATPLGGKADFMID